MMGVKINRELKRAKESDNMSCKESIYEYLTRMLITETIIKTKWNYLKTQISTDSNCLKIS